MADDSTLHPYGAETSYAGVATTERPPQDPLAELARLIGQDDLFEQMRRDAARAGEGAATPPSESDETHTAMEAYAPEPTELRGSLDPAPHTATAREDYPEQTYDEPEPTYASAPHRYAEPARQPASERYREAPEAAHVPAYAAQPAYAAPSGQADPYYADGPADPYAAAAYDPAQEYDDPTYADEPAPPPRRRTGLKTIAAILGLAVVGTAGAYGYRSMAGSGSTSGQPPVISGPSTPLKVAATGPGKEQGSRTTYDRADRGQPERMVPREEQPLDPPRTSSTRAPLTTGSAPGLPGVPNQQMAALPAPAGGATALTGSAEPKKVKTMTIRPDLSVAPESATARQPGAARPPARAASQPPTATSAQAADPLRAVNNPTPVRTASIPTATSAVAAGGHVVQVASQKSEEDAQATFRMLQTKYPGALAGRQPLIRKVELGQQGTFYRVQVGPFATSDAANGLCEKLKDAGGQCIVQRN